MWRRCLPLLFSGFWGDWKNANSRKHRIEWDRLADQNLNTVQKSSTSIKNSNKVSMDIQNIKIQTPNKNLESFTIFSLFFVFKKTREVWLKKPMLSNHQGIVIPLPVGDGVGLMSPGWKQKKSAATLMLRFGMDMLTKDLDGMLEMTHPKKKNFKFKQMSDSFKNCEIWQIFLGFERQSRRFFWLCVRESFLSWAILHTLQSLKTWKCNVEMDGD